MKLYFGNTVTTVTTIMILVLLGFIGESIAKPDKHQLLGTQKSVPSGIWTYDMLLCSCKGRTRQDNSEHD